MEVGSLYREPPREQQRATAAVEFLDVFRIYCSGPAETVALRGLDLRIEAGEFVAVLGPSGSGKSTFLSLAAGLEQPSAGEVRVFGQPLDRLDEAGLAAFRARRIAIIFQSENLLPLLTARENVATAVRLGHRPNARSLATTALGTVDLAPRVTHRPAQLSGGEQQRVALAAAGRGPGKQRCSMRSAASSSRPAGRSSSKGGRWQRSTKRHVAGCGPRGSPTSSRAPIYCRPSPASRTWRSRSGPQRARTRPLTR